MGTVAAPIRTDIDQLLDREALKGERWRAGILALILLMPACAITASTLFGRTRIQEVLPPGAPRYVVLGAFLVTLAIEVRIFFRARSRLRENSSPPLAGRIAQSALEASLP